MSELRLLVPVNIEALVVGKDSDGVSGPAKETKTQWVNLKLDLQGLYRLDRVLGQQLVQPFRPSTGLHEPGIHLHWALPDGLTRGVTTGQDGRPKFPFVPNRWLVARFWDQGRRTETDLQSKAWIVESDTISTDRSAAVWPTLRSAKLEKQQDYFVFVGKPYELSKWPGETSAPSVDITAIGYGDPAFAAYYPACKGILGFHDKDLDEFQDVTLSYMVVGWYSDPSKDPLQQSLKDTTNGNLTAILEQLRELAGFVGSDQLAKMEGFVKLQEFLGKAGWIYSGLAESQKKVHETQELARSLKHANESKALLIKVQNEKQIDNGSAIAELETTIATLQGKLQSCSAATSDLQNTLPVHILCHGIITGIQWKSNPDGGVPRGRPIDIAIGETAVESLTTLFGRELGNGLGKLLAVFQYDLLSELQKPGGDGIVDHKVHERSYARLVRGIRWDLLRETHPAFSGFPEDRAAAMEDRAAPIPGDVRLLLERLNTPQREINRLKRERDSLRRELYATWYKRVLNIEAKKVKGEALNQRITGLQQEIERVSAAIDALEDPKGGHPKGTEWGDIQQALDAFLPGWKLHQFDEPEFWRSNDPVVLMSGDAFQRSGRHGEDGRYRSDGRLLCRLSGQETTGIRVKIPYAKEGKDIEFGSADVDKWGAPFASLAQRSIPTEANNLFREALLLTLDSKRAQDIVTAAYEKNEPGLAKNHSTDIQALARELLDVYLTQLWQEARNSVDNPKLRKPETDKDDLTTWELVGTFPSPIVMNCWGNTTSTQRSKRNPWLPLFLQWQVSWTPTYSEIPQALNNWKLNDQGTSFEGQVGPQGEPQIYVGTTLLTPSATLQFGERLRQYNLTHDNPKLRTFQTAVSSMNVLCQSLGGLIDQLLMRKGLLELRPLEPGSSKAAGPQFSDIYNAVKDVDWLSPLTDEKFLPVRAGQLKLERLWIIDAFGQFLQLEQENKVNGLQPIRPERLAGPNGSVRFEPRLAQPARLTIEWPCAGRWEAAGKTASEEEEEFNPICGWIVPNFIDESLMIYDAKGYALGALQIVQRKSWREGVGSLRPELESFHPVDIPGSRAFSLGAAPLGEKPNPHLGAFVTGLLSLTEGSGQAFSDLLDKMNEAFSSGGGSGSNHNPNLALLIGRPLALVRASLRLEVDGPIACAQGWDAVQGGQTGGIETLEFPIRLGDCRRWNDTLLADDGLVGFFLNRDYARFYPAFGLVGRADDKYSKYNFAPPLTIKKPLDLTLLMDPSRGISVTSGILPRTIHYLPYSDIAETLENKQVVIFTGPVVSPESEREIRMPQPSDIYGQWSWTHHPAVKVAGEKSIVDIQKDKGRFADTPLQITEGWLKLITSPLAIRAFTVKGKNPVEETKTPNRDGEPEGPARFEVAVGGKTEKIILTWSVSGAEELELKEGESKLFKSRRHPLPTQYAISVVESATFTLVATGRAEKLSEESESKMQVASKTIMITVKQAQ